jgi:hypothetical protein
MNLAEEFAITFHFILVVVERMMKCADDVHLGAMLGRAFA